MNALPKTVIVIGALVAISSLIFTIWVGDYANRMSSPSNELLPLPLDQPTTVKLRDGVQYGVFADSDKLTPYTEVPVCIISWRTTWRRRLEDVYDHRPQYAPSGRSELLAFAEGTNNEYTITCTASPDFPSPLYLKETDVGYNALFGLLASALLIPTGVFGTVIGLLITMGGIAWLRIRTE